jgi:uridylate kinase
MSVSNKNKYRRVLIKLSGEALGGKSEDIFCHETLDRIVEAIYSLSESGVQVALVVGGGNIHRGAPPSSRRGFFDRVAGDHMGMLATVINGLALQSKMSERGMSTEVFSSVQMPLICEEFTQRNALRALEENRVAIFVGGTAAPFFTTDTAAVLRSIEMGCDVLMKATQVDGVYSADPKKDPAAERFDELSYKDILARNLRIMDLPAISLAQEYKLPILVFSLQGDDCFRKVLQGEERFTLIS